MFKLQLTPEMLLGPLSGLVISLVFAVTQWRFSLRMLSRFEAVTERMLRAFEDEVKACEQRYTQLLTEIFRMKDRY
jgi:hypothetical protein